MKKIAKIVQWIFLWIITLIIGGLFLFAPFFAIVIMQENVNAGVTASDIDIREQIDAEMLIQ